MRKLRQETLHEKERAFAHRGKEFVPLLLMVIGIARRVADYTDAEEWHPELVTGVRNGSGLHLAGQPFGETGFYFGKGLLVGDKLVACADKAFLHAQVLPAGNGRCTVQQQRVGIETGGESLHLAILVAHAAPYIMVHRLAAHHRPWR